MTLLWWNNSNIELGENTITNEKINSNNDDISNNNYHEHIELEDSKFDFKGDVNLIADQKDLNFDGYFIVNHRISSI